MLVKHKISIVLTLTSLLVFCSCSQSSNVLDLEDGNVSAHSQADAQVDNGADSALNPGATGLPALPDTRIAMEVDGEYLSAGMSIIDGSGAYEIDPESGIVYQSSYGEEMSWAVYGVPASEIANGLNVELFLEEGQQVWIAIADYEFGSWRIASEVVNAETVMPSIPFDETLLSPMYNNMYIAVICLPGNSVQLHGYSYIHASLWSDFWEWYHHDVDLTGMTLMGKTTWGPNPIAIGSRRPGEQATATATGYTCSFLHNVVSYDWTISGGPATLENGASTTGTSNRITTGNCTAGQTITVEVTATCTGGLTSSVATASFDIV